MYLGSLGASIKRISKSDCASAGGVASNCVEVYGTGARANLSSFLCDCYIPDKAPYTPYQPPANVNVNVSPQISTQISPQISPAFQQQFQPSGSPMTAGTTQTSAPPAPPAGPIGVNSTSMQPSAPAQLPPAPSYPAPSYPTYSAPPPAAPAMPEQLPVSPLPSQTPPVSAPVVSTAAPVQAGFDWKIGAVLAAGLFGVMALSGKKGK